MPDGFFDVVEAYNGSQKNRQTFQQIIDKHIQKRNSDREFARERRIQ